MKHKELYNFFKNTFDVELHNTDLETIINLVETRKLDLIDNDFIKMLKYRRQMFIHFRDKEFISVNLRDASEKLIECFDEAVRILSARSEFKEGK